MIVFFLFFFSRLNYSIGQGQSWPFHGTNMILHGCATFFFGCICQRTLQLQNLASLMATLLFALHPIHTEAVSYVMSKLGPSAEQSWDKSTFIYPKSLENSKLALVCCSDEWRGWVSSDSPNSESCTSTSPFFH